MTEAKVTVVLTNWMRPVNVADLIYALENQTHVPEIHLWDNAGNDSQLSKYAIRACDLYVRSKVNKFCYPRWILAQQAETPYVLVMDDDIEIVSDTFVEDIMKAYEEKEAEISALGICGVNLVAEKHYAECDHYGLGHRKPFSKDIDILKGRCIFTSVDNLDASEFTEFRDDMKITDDIVVSSLLNAYGHLRIFEGYQRYLKTLPEGEEALSKQPGHYEERERVRREYFVI